MPVDWDKVEKLRKAKDITMEQAAAIIGLSGKAHWNNIVKEIQKDVTVTQLERIAKMLGKKPSDLLK